jgi:formate dehydrogenase gamma subunit
MNIKRFTFNQRVQHWVLVLTFLLLVVTGLPLKYRETWGKSWLEFMGFMTARSIHKWAALGMTGLGVYHVLYYVLIDRGKRNIYPYLQDIKDFLTMLKFRLGMVPEEPKFGRFHFLQKFDYWGAFWGFVIMIGSGLVLWFREEFAFLPKWAMESARTAHAEEAMLAVVFVLVFHMIHAHLRREVFPIDTVIISGNISDERMKEEHPLELERL